MMGLQLAGVRSSPEPSVDSCKLASSKMWFCEFKLLPSFHEPTQYRFFPPWLIFILIDPEKEPGAGYILEIRKRNSPHWKEVTHESGKVLREGDNVDP